jgi:hypothetical protein
MLMTANVPPAVDVPHLRVIRSLTAEATLYIQLERGHQVSTTYAAEMKKLTRQGLLSEQQGAKSKEVGQFAHAALHALAANDEPALSQIRSKLTRLLDP